jgi:hypothetical protein
VAGFDYRRSFVISIYCPIIALTQRGYPWVVAGAFSILNGSSLRSPIAAHVSHRPFASALSRRLHRGRHHELFLK